MRYVIIIEWKDEAEEQDKDKIISSLLGLLQGYQFRSPIIESVSINLEE